jgi:predicted HicB family RNase H-like nuclease
MEDKYTYKVSWSDDDQEFVGLCLELPSLSWLAKKQEAAFTGIRKLVAEVIKDMRDSGEQIPEPMAAKKYSGKLMLRVPPSLHRELAMHACESNISLNRYISDRLASKQQR